MKCPTCGRDIPSNHCARCDRAAKTPSLAVATANGHAPSASRADLLRELLEEDSGPAAPKTRLLDNYAADENDRPLPIRQKVPDASAEKKPAVRGKPTPYRNPRTYAAAFLITAAGMAGLTFARGYAGTVADLHKASEKAPKELAEQYENAQKIKEEKRGYNKNLGAKLNPGQQPADTPDDASSTRKVAPYASRINNWGVSVIYAELVSGQSGEVDRLKLTLRFSNYGQRAAVHPNWTRPDSRIELRDQFGNLYNPIPEPHEPKTIQPAKSEEDYILFAAPTIAGNLELDLYAVGFGRPFEFTITGISIKRKPTPSIFTTVTPMPTPVPTIIKQATPPPPLPYNPEDDGKLRADVIAEYNEGIAAMRQRALGMSYDRAVKFKKTQPEKLRKDLGKKYKLDDTQIKRILRGY